MLKFILWFILIYCLIRFIFNFLIPVARTARRMKRQVQDFQDQVNRQQAQYHQQGSFQQSAASQSSNGSATAAPKPRKEDYIDFEEVK